MLNLVKDHNCVYIYIYIYIAKNFDKSMYLEDLLYFLSIISISRILVIKCIICYLVYQCKISICGRTNAAMQYISIRNFIQILIRLHAKFHTWFDSMYFTKITSFTHMQIKNVGHQSVSNNKIKLSVRCNKSNTRLSRKLHVQFYFGYFIFLRCD